MSIMKLPIEWSVRFITANGIPRWSPDNPHSSFKKAYKDAQRTARLPDVVEVNIREEKTIATLEGKSKQKVAQKR